MSGKPTPGPWEVFEYADHSGLCIGPPFTEEYLKGHVRDVCAIPSTSVTYPRSMSAQQKADARLISAAPELYDALKSILAEVDQALNEGGISALSLTAKELAAAAIAKAEGKDINNTARPDAALTSNPEVA